jgi:hypothetical protein
MQSFKVKILAALTGIAMLGFVACQPEEYLLGDIISKEALKYSITQNPEDPNMIILRSETPGVTPMWVTPMGRSTRIQDTVKIPFAGEYKFVYGVQSAGGFVQADTFKLNLTTNNLTYVDDPLWTLLTGGVGKEKTWLLDLDEEGISKFFKGPLYFFGTNDSWLSVTDGIEVGGDSWSWQADWPGNTWIMPKGDYGTMTFNLKGGANIIVEHKMLGRTEQGTYFLDAKAKTLTMSDASPLHDQNRDKQVVNWGDLKLMSLTENTMQLAALRDKALSGEDPVLFVYNFISKEYADSWQPPVDGGEPVIDLDLGGISAGDLLSVTKTTSKTWKLSTASPFNWANLDGTFMNNWNAIGDYPDWTGFNASVIPDIENIRITFHTDGKVVTRSNDGTEKEGTYSTSDDNVISFDGITPSFAIVGWVNISTTEENQWKIVKVGRTGNTITDIWFGKRDAVKPEYMVYHFVLSPEGSAPDPVEQARKAIVKALTGNGTRSFKIDDKWPVDWGTKTYGGGWTSPATFADFTSNTWMWTQDVYNSIQEPRLTFSTNAQGKLIATKTQNGETSTTEVIIDAANMMLTIDSGLLKFGGEAHWMPVTNEEWKIIRTDLDKVATDGIWFATIIPKGDDFETIMFRYVVAGK